MDEPIGARREPLRPGATYVTEEQPRSSWLRWALPLALLAGLVWFLSSRNRPVDVPTVRVPEPAAPTTPTTPMPAAPAAPMQREELGALVDKKLPNGTTLKIPANGVETKLIGFIEDPSKAVDKETWFSFDRLEFQTGSNELAAGSQEQLRNIAEIMKAYPSVSVKVGGYTDNVGNSAHNMTLSTERATNTMNALAALGVDKARMAAEGYGQEHPVADNSTEEGRQRNRRIDIRVTKK
jgi:outer membrane protein OmpA-like peptidoglycan-associated protein